MDYKNYEMTEHRQIKARHICKSRGTACSLFSTFSQKKNMPTRNVKNKKIVEKTS